jgi:hypothetical protein
MSKLLLSYGKCCDVRAIISVHLQNQVPGLASRNSQKRITAPRGFFMRARSHLSMVGWVGASKDAPGSFVTGKANPAQFTTKELAFLVVNSKITKGIR